MRANKRENSKHIYRKYLPKINHNTTAILISTLLLAITTSSKGQVQITEWLYSGTDGEFIEFTNTGDTAVDMTGWSFSDKSEVPGVIDLSGFGTVEPGESVILTEAEASVFASAWNLGGTKIIGGLTENLDRNDQINLYNADGLLEDHLVYGDSDYPGTPRARYASCNIPDADYDLTMAQVDWKLATERDSFGSQVSTGGDIASPGRIIGYALSDYDMDGDVGVSDFATFVSCFTGTDESYEPLLAEISLSPDTNGIIAADADADYDVDLIDFAVFANCFSGEGNRAATLCGCSIDEDTATEIILNVDTININGTNVTADGTTATITGPGKYIISGSLSDGQIIVNSEDEGLVEIVLADAEISNSTSAAIYVMEASFTSLILADGTENYLSDGQTYIYSDATVDEPGSCIFSKDSMAISGGGELDIYGNYNDAIVSKDKLVIYGGTINAVSVDDGIRGKDCLLVYDGDISINCEGDGLKSDNEDDPNMGYICIAGGSLNINSGSDGISAETDIIISDGDISIISGGGHTAAINSDISSKGIKGLETVTIDGGTLSLNCADDAIHSNNAITINSGSFTIASGDDGVHADSTLELNGGTMYITSCYEGLEAAVITINDGYVNVVSSDDGINVAGGTDGSGGTDPWQPPHMGGGIPGDPGDPGDPSTGGDYFLYINGGYIVVNATGDGLDANGNIEITGGTILVNGPTADNNNAVDFDGTCNISGGTLVAVGSSQMAQALSNSSTQRSIKITYNQTQATGTLLHIQNSTTGEEIVTFASEKYYKSCVFSSPALVAGASYKLYSGGSSTGTENDGLYLGGDYTPGTLKTTFTTSNIATNLSVY